MGPHEMETCFPQQWAVSCLMSTLKRGEQAGHLGLIIVHLLFVGFCFTFISDNVNLCGVLGMLLLTLRQGFFFKCM